jgi:hypothetical protein
MPTAVARMVLGLSTRRTKLLLGACVRFEESIDLSDDGRLEAAHDVAAGLALSGATRGVGLGLVASRIVV